MLRQIKHFRNIFSFIPKRNFCSVPDVKREVLDFDVVIVGGGCSGLSTAISLKQKCQENNTDLSVCVVEKGAEIGSHIISGNVFDPKGLNELFPNQKQMNAPIKTKVTKDKLYLLTKNYAIPSPIPPFLRNKGNYVISLGELTRQMAEQAESVGVEILPGFSGSQVLYNNANQVTGIVTSDVGLDKDRKPTESYSPGVELRAKLTVLAEGCRGSLTEEVIKRYNLRENCDPQTYAIGLKEVWEVEPSKFKSGLVQHTALQPTPLSTHAGSFLYHMEPNFVHLGYVAALNYSNPYFSPYNEFQKQKHHPVISSVLDGGKCVSYGSRCINEGGQQSIPRLYFPGGLLVGCSAGFLNSARIKGAHTAIKSGIVAGQQIHEFFKGNLTDSSELIGGLVHTYEKELKRSQVFDELYKVRNIQQVYKYGMIPGIIYSGLEGFVLRGKLPFTFHNKRLDQQFTKKADQCVPINYPKPDNRISFDILTNLQRSGTMHSDTEPSHLRIKPEFQKVADTQSFEEFAGPEQRFCPAKVYEYVEDNVDEQQKNNSISKSSLKKHKLVINSQNCLHCKCCSIKTPFEFIKWSVPEGGSGPKYESM